MQQEKRSQTNKQTN